MSFSNKPFHFSNLEALLPWSRLEWELSWKARHWTQDYIPEQRNVKNERLEGQLGELQSTLTKSMLTMNVKYVPQYNTNVPTNT